MASFEDTYKTLYENVHKISDEKDFKLSLFEHKKNGTFHLGIREFKHTKTYDGASKNGIMFAIGTPKEMDDYLSWLTTAFNEAKEKM